MQVDLKNVTGIDTSKLAVKPDLASLKSEVDKLHIDKLVPVPVHLIKLSNVVKNDVAAKTVYDKLVVKVNNIDLVDFLKKLNMTQINQNQKKPDVSSLVKKKNKTDYNTKTSEIEKKITDHTHEKYITTLEFNTFTAKVFGARLAPANLETKTYFDAKLISLNKKN